MLSLHRAFNTLPKESGRGGVHLSSTDTNLEVKVEEAGPAIAIISASVIPISCELGLSSSFLGTKDSSF